MDLTACHSLCLGLLLSIVDASIVATALVPIEYYFDEFFEVLYS